MFTANDPYCLILKYNYNASNYTNYKNRMFGILLEHPESIEHRQVVYCVSQELEDVMRLLGADNDSDINVYRYGSRVYGTASENSDYDYVAVKTHGFGMYGQSCIQKNLNGIDLTLYSVNGFQEQIDNYEISALECVYLPANMVLLGKSFPAPATIDLGKLRSAISAKASNSFVKAKKKFIVEKDRNILVGKKSLFHSLRIPIFGQQIARYGKITDYSAANHYWSDISANTSENWDDYQKIYKPIHNYEMTEFRKHCPKG